MHPSRESALQLLRRASSRPLSTGISSVDSVVSSLGQSGLQGGQVLEIYGRSGSAKTEILYHTVLNCALPSSYLSVSLPGHQSIAIIIDLDFRFNIIRFVQLLEQRVHQLLFDQRSVDPILRDPAAFLASPGFQQLQEAVLERVIVITCPAICHFFVALKEVEKICLSYSTTSAAPLSDPTVRLLCIDNISAFYFQLRAEGRLSLYDLVSAQLRAVLDRCKLVLICTKQVLFQGQVTDMQTSLQHKEYLGKRWSQLVTFRLAVRCNLSGKGSGDEKDISAHDNSSSSSSGTHPSSETRDARRILEDGRTWSGKLTVVGQNKTTLFRFTVGSSGVRELL